MEIKQILQKALNEITDADPRWNALEMERKPYTANVGDGNPDDLGGMSKEDIEEEVVKLFELLSVDKPDLEAVVGLLNGPALNTPYGKACLSHGNDNDKVKVTDGEFDIGSAKPTQSNIWFFKSVLFSVSDTKFKTSVGSLTNTAKKSPALKVNYAEMNGTPYILDGHHRWSGQFAFGEPNHQLAGLNFQFPTNVIQRALAALQVAIASNVKTGTSIPSAGPSKGSPVNCYDASAAELAQKLIDNIDKPATSFDPKANGNILSTEWLDMTLDGAKSQFIKWLSAAIDNYGALEAAGIDLDKLIKDYGQEEESSGAVSMKEKYRDLPRAEALLEFRAENTGGELQSCPLRKVIAHEIGRRYTSLPKPETGLPKRKFMPQLDGASGPEDDEGNTPELSPAELAQQFRDGNVNWDIEYTLPDEQEAKNESIDLNRWGKLAGILKD